MYSPPQPPVCLTRTDTSRAIRGGTVIAEDVLDLETHLELLPDPDRYRHYVSICPRCKHPSVHALCFRDRKLLPPTAGGHAHSAASVVAIRLYRCATADCRAVYTVLPAFIARHLQRAWSVVAEAIAEKQTVPKNTLRRWLARLRSNALDLLQRFLSLADDRTQSRLAADPPTDRSSFLFAFETLLGPRHLMARVAGWMHRLEPGIRLM